SLRSALCPSSAPSRSSVPSWATPSSWARVSPRRRRCCCSLDILPRNSGGFELPTPTNKGRQLRFTVHRQARQHHASPRSHRVPPGDGFGCIEIGVGRVSAGLAPEDRLALAVLRRRIPTDDAMLTAERRVDPFDSI